MDENKKSGEMLSEQEKFWLGKFGDEYQDRNNSNELLAQKTAFYASVIKGMDKFGSCIEFGSNIGLNLLAVRNLVPDCELSAIEINPRAVEELKRIKNLQVYNQSIFDFVPDSKRDVVIIQGVLIHINPEKLNEVYDLLYKTSKKYILIAEYYNQTPVEVTYRGNQDKLFKRDFAGEMMDKFDDLSLVNYGFVYHRDYQFPMDDITWFLLKK